MKSNRYEQQLDPVDRETWLHELAAPRNENITRGHSRLFAFRCGGEWFAIDPHAVVLVEPMPPVHSIPHRPKILAGAVNLRGAVTLCFSLKEALQCAPGPESGQPLLLALQHDGWQVACRADEASGIISFDPETLTPPPATLAAAGSRHITGLFTLKGRSIACLDTKRLFNTFEETVR